MILSTSELKKDASTMTTDQIYGYLDLWLGSVLPRDIVETIEQMKNTYLYRLDYLAISPMFSELCRRDEKYKGVSCQFDEDDVEIRIDEYISAAIIGLYLSYAVYRRQQLTKKKI